MSYINPAHPQIIKSPQPSSICLKNQVVILGRDDTATLPLPAPTVSRHHATIETDGRGRIVVYDHSTNGTFINGVRVTGSAVLPDRATIRIGPFALVRYGARLTLIDSGEQIRLEARGLVIQHRGKRRLDDVTLAIEPGQLVALVGGSGAVLNLNAMILEPVKVMGKVMPQLLEVSPVYETSWFNLGLNWLMLCLHSGVYLFVTFWLQKQKDNFATK